MAEPVRELPLAESGEPDRGFPDGEPSGQSFLQRWGARLDGRLELVELPLTPELFLDPQLGDKMVQRFGVSPEGDQIDICEAKSGKRLLRPAEGEEALQEVERLRAEIETAQIQGLISLAAWPGG